MSSWGFFVNPTDPIVHLKLKFSFYKYFKIKKKISGELCLIKKKEEIKISKKQKASFFLEIY